MSKQIKAPNEGRMCERGRCGRRRWHVSKHAVHRKDEETDRWTEPPDRSEAPVDEESPAACVPLCKRVD